MFRIAKYYVLVNIYKRAKSSILLVLASIIGMLLTSFVFSDLLTMSDGSNRSLLVGIKWLILFALIGLTGYHLRKIFRSASLPFSGETKADLAPDKKREHLLGKTKLHSRSERILEKYRNV